MKRGLRYAPNIQVGRETVSAPSFIETVGASLAYKYNPILDFATETSRFGKPGIRDEGWRPRENIPEDLKGYGSYLMQTNNQEHMDFRVNSLREGLKTRETLSRSGLGASFAAEIFDPVNFIAVPLRFTTLGATALRSGLQTGGVVAAQEAIRAPIDPLATTAETAINVGSAFVLGTALGGALSVPAARRASAIQRTEVEIESLRQAIEPLEGVEIDPSIATSAFTDSWLFKSVTTPMKRVLQDEKVPNSVKLTMLDIANDAGILLNANKQGFAIKNSVFQNAKLRDGEWVQAYDEMVSIWGESQGSGVIKPLDYMYKHSDFEDWLTEVDSKAMRGQKPADDFEAKAMDQLNNFYSRWESRLSERGLIGNKGFYIRDIDKRQAKIDDINSNIETFQGTPVYAPLKKIVDKNQSIVDSHKLMLQELESSGPTLPANEEIFRPRYWDKDAISKDRSGLEKILADWFRNNPEGYGRDGMGKWTKVKYSTDEDAIAKRASDAVDSILGLKDVTDLDVASFGYGKSKHLKHRGIDIPNKLVLDYMHRNPVSIMKAYTARTAAKYEFSVKFDGQEIDDVIDDKMSEMIRSGMTVDQANAAAKDIRHMYDRVAGTVLREPDAMNQKVAEVLRTAAQLGYLGKAGLSTISEPAKIMMEHGIGKTMKGLFSVLSDSQLKMGAKEARIAGEALEILMGSSHLRLVDDMGNNPLRSNFMDKSKNAFYLLNGLAPITRIFKDFDGMMRSHTLIDYSVRWTQGKASKMEQEYLLRYGIDKETADKISASNWQKSESGMYMANTEAWADLDLDSIKSEVSKKYKPSSKSVFTMSEKQLLNKFSKEFYVDRIITDQDIVSEVFNNLGTPNILGHASGIGLEAPATVYVNFDNVKSSYAKLKNREDLDLFKSQLDEALANGTITDVAHTHQMAMVNNIDLINSADEFAEFVLMHELHHTTTPQRVGETNAAYEKRIDDLSFSYIRDKRKEGLNLAVEKEYASRVKDVEETTKSFRNALSSGIANTILMGTPADKPIITDGIVYIPMHVARKFGMKEDSKYTGYARIENGLLGMPFQFYSYALAATNKTLAAYGHGQLKNRFLGTAIAMGLGYMTLELKTPDFVELSPQDKFARAFDFSGVAALHSDLFYTAMSTSLALGGPNITGGLLQPRYPQEPSVTDAVTGLLGAGPSIGMEYANGMANMLTGNVGEGSKEFIRALPFSNLWMWNDFVNRITRMLESELDDGPSGFGRY